MTMPKKGTRPITVEGVNYRFKINADKEKEITKIVIENSETGEIIKRERNNLSEVTPADIEGIIKSHNTK